MLHWDNIQIGDVLEWHNLPEKPKYKIVSKVRDSVYETGWRVDFQDIITNNIYRGDFREGGFSYACLVTPRSKEELILEKIKYLDARFNTRKQHVI